MPSVAVASASPPSFCSVCGAVPSSVAGVSTPSFATRICAGVPDRLGVPLRLLSSSPITKSGSNSEGSGPLPVGRGGLSAPACSLLARRLEGDEALAPVRDPERGLEVLALGEDCCWAARACSSAILESTASLIAVNRCQESAGGLIMIQIIPNLPATFLQLVAVHVILNKDVLVRERQDRLNNVSTRVRVTLLALLCL